MVRQLCRPLLALLVGAALWTATPASWATETPDERAQVAGVARDYLESWYTADADRMARALHPDMVKRYVDSLPTGRQVVHSLTTAAREYVATRLFLDRSRSEWEYDALVARGYSPKDFNVTMREEGRKQHVGTEVPGTELGKARPGGMVGS